MSEPETKTIGSEVVVGVQHGGYTTEDLAACEKLLGALGLWGARVIRGICPTCGGSRKCGYCSGDGLVPREDESGWVRCGPCGGTGDCPDCKVWAIAAEAWEAFVLACDDTGCLVGADSDESVTVITKQAAAERWAFQGNDVACHVDFETWWGGLEERATTILQALLPGARVAKEVRVVFDGPPGPKSGRFVEVERPDGASVSVGDWHEREDGLWELRMLAILQTEGGGE